MATRILAKLGELARGVGGAAGPILLAGTAIAIAHLARRRRLLRALAVGAALQAVAIATYVWMDRDWT